MSDRGKALTPEDIIRMAREVGASAFDQTVVFTYEEAARFAALVAAAVYENDDMFTEAYAGGFSAGAAAEREACAVAGGAAVMAGEDYAGVVAAIRARGQG
jgi:hypothetical protein